MKKILSLLLLAPLLLGTLASCASNNTTFSNPHTYNNSGSDTSDTSAVPTPTPQTGGSDFMIDENCVVVYDADASDSVNIIAKLAEELTLSKASDTSSLTWDKEILIGDTTRSESTAVTIPAGYDYTIRTSGTKLVIKATSAITLDAACLYLTQKISADGKNFPSGFAYNGKVDFSEKRVMVANQGQNKIQIYDISDGALGTPVWEYDTPINLVAGLKARDTVKYGEIIIFCSGTEAMAIKYDTKELLFKAAAADNAHSVEITPDGKIFAVASSTGNAVKFYNTDTANPSTKQLSNPTTHSLTDAHAVLYDDVHDKFYMAGGNTLVCYKVELDGTTGVKLAQAPCHTTTLNDSYIHDLAPVAGDSNKLYITAHKAVYIFDKSTHTFTQVLNQQSVKGIGSYTDGSFVYTYPDGKDDGNGQSWASNTLYLRFNLPFYGSTQTVKLFIGNDNRVYKIRALYFTHTY